MFFSSVFEAKSHSDYLNLSVLFSKSTNLCVCVCLFYFSIKLRFNFCWDVRRVFVPKSFVLKYRPRVEIKIRSFSLLKIEKMLQLSIFQAILLLLLLLLLLYPLISN